MTLHHSSRVSVCVTLEAILPPDTSHMYPWGCVSLRNSLLSSNAATPLFYRESQHLHLIPISIFPHIFCNLNNIPQHVCTEQTQTYQICHIHEYTAGIGVMVSTWIGIEFFTEVQWSSGVVCIIFIHHVMQWSPLTNLLRAVWVLLFYRYLKKKSL